MTTQPIDKPFRVGLFDTIAQANKAVHSLLAAGFTKDQLAVVCSDKYKEQFFRAVPTPEPAGSYTPGAITTGGLVGATLGGLALAVTAITTGGAVLLAAGTVLVGGGAIAGSFTGAMATRGFEKEIADYYDQAVQKGKILVAAEVHGAGHEAKLLEAERILTASGVEPVALAEG